MKGIAFRQYGSEDVLELLELPRPVPKPDQVLIRVAAAGVNPADWMFREGQFKAFARLSFPFIPGAEVSGVVEEVGTQVTHLRKGDAVYTAIPMAKSGGYAEYVAVDADHVSPLPANLTFAEAAAVPLTALTALQALRDKARLRAGTHLLINGASGGVGSFTVQIAKAMGTHVTALCSTKNMELVRSLGADQVLDYQIEDITAQVDQYDYVFDAVNTFPLGRGIRVVQRGGVLVSVNPIRGNPLTQLWARSQGRAVRSVIVQPSASDLTVITGWIEQGKVRIVVDRTYKLEQAREAQRYSASHRVRGKLVLLVDETLGKQEEAAQAFEMEKQI